MSNLADYRASIKRLIEAGDTSEAFIAEGIDGRTAVIVAGSKAFQASRSASMSTGTDTAKPCVKMPHRQAK